ncbi:hypothetical protein OSTOST_00577 [Ostertagia ostertagi]
MVPIISTDGYLNSSLLTSHCMDTMKLIPTLTILLVVFIMFVAKTEQSDVPSVSRPLHRISRSSLPLSSLLVPYPRVGKRSSISSDNTMYSPMSIKKRLYVARVGKRRYLYTARVGK